MTDEDWTPPSEADQKVLIAKRERNDKISKLMGEYLLKGHKMLATTCQVCDAIEFEDKSGRVYCIGCQEVDGGGENRKDNPVINRNEPIRSRPERQEVQEPIIVPQKAYLLGSAERLASASAMPVSESCTTSQNTRAEAIACIKAVETRMTKTRILLESTPDSALVKSSECVALLKECADCLLSLQRLAQ